MRIGRFIGFLAMGLFLIIGCGNNQSDTTGGSILVEVSDASSTTNPFYTWFNPSDNSNGTAEKLTVARTSDLNKVVWGIVSNQPPQESITSPWKQGDVSANVSTISTDEVNLQSGVTYRITVTKADNTSGFVEYKVP